MIQYYKSTNTNYDFNGDKVLFPYSATYDTDTQIFTLTHPLDDAGKLLEEDGVIKAPSYLLDDSGNHKDQLYRIFKIDKTESQIEASAYPIFYDTKSKWLTDVRPTDKNGQDALNIILSGTGFEGSSNIQDLSTAYFQNVSVFNALFSDEDNSFLSRWGGEYEFDNKKIIINTQIGSDRGVSIRYGKNLPQNGIQVTVDISEVVTRIYPKSYNGHTIGGTGYVDSSLINNYVCPHPKEIKYDKIKLQSDLQGEQQEDDIICESIDELNAALVNAANDEFAKGVDKPQLSIKIDMVLLENSANYLGFKNLERVSKGDTVHVYDERMGIDIEARVVDLVFDALQKAVTEVTIGTDNFDYIKDTAGSINKIENITNNNGDVKAETIDGIIDGLKTQFKAQTEVGATQQVRAMLFVDNNPDSPTYGAMSIGTMGFQIANSKLPNGEWDWRTFGTGSGFTADQINAGKINTNLIEGWDELILKVGDLSEEVSAITRGEILQSISVQYGINDTDESPPTEYSDTFPESYDNKYLWLRNVYTYEKSVDYGDPILLGLNDTANQKAITSVDLLYVISNDGEEAPISGWSEELGEWLPDQYIWQKELITFSDNTSKETDPRVIGGIKSGKTIITSDTAPTDNSALWLDTSKEPNQLKENVNGEWVIVNDQSGLINEQIGQVIEDTSSEIETLKNQVITQISSIQTITDDQEERINKLNTQVSTSLNGLTVTQTQLDSIKDQLTNDYVTNATWESVIQLGDGRLAISVSNSPIKMVLSNSELAFYDGDERIAWISNSEFHNAKAVITKEILLGDDDHRLSWEFIPDVGWVRRNK